MQSHSVIDLAVPGHFLMAANGQIPLTANTQGAGRQCARRARLPGGFTAA